MDEKDNKGNSNHSQNSRNQLNQTTNGCSCNQQSGCSVYSLPKDSSSSNWDVFYRQRIKELEDKNVRLLEEKNARLVKDLDKISQEKSLLENEKKSVQASLNKLKQDYDILTYQNIESCAVYKRDNENWMANNLTLEKNLSNANEKIEKLAHEKKKLECDMSNIKRDLESSKTFLEEKKDCIEKLENSLSRKETAYKEVMLQRDQLESELDSLRQHSAILERNLNDAKQMIVVGQKNLNNYLKKEEESREHQIQSYFRELTDFRERNTTLEDENKQLNLLIQELENRIREMEKEKSSLLSIEQNTSTYESQINEWKQKYRELNRLLIEQKSNYDEQIMNLKHSQIQQQLDVNEKHQKLDTNLRSFILQFFVKLFTKVGMDRKRIDGYVMELMDEKLDLLDLLQKAKKFMQEENI